MCGSRCCWATQMGQMCSPIPHSKLDPLPASISSLLAEFPCLQAKPIHCKYSREKLTIICIFLQILGKLLFSFTVMALLTTMGQPSAPMTRIMTLTLPAVQYLAQHIHQDPTGSTPAGNSSSWAKNLAGVRDLIYTGFGLLHPLLGTPYQCY